MPTAPTPRHPPHDPTSIAARILADIVETLAKTRQGISHRQLRKTVTWEATAPRATASPKRLLKLVEIEATSIRKLPAPADVPTCHYLEDPDPPNESTSKSDSLPNADWLSAQVSRYVVPYPISIGGLPTSRASPPEIPLNRKATRNDPHPNHPHHSTTDTSTTSKAMADTHGMTPDEMILSGLAAYRRIRRRRRTPRTTKPDTPTTHDLARALSMLAHHLGHHPHRRAPGIATNDTTGSVSVLIDGDERASSSPQAMGTNTRPIWHRPRGLNGRPTAVVASMAQTLPRALVGYLGGLTLAGGDHNGEPFTVLPWERRFLFGAFRGAGDAGLTVARGNGKSALCAAVASAVVDPAGPLTGRRREVVVCAASFGQGRVIFEDVLAFLGARYDLGDRSEWRRQDSANLATLEYRPSGARVKCVGSDPATAHGLRPALALLDEPAQWEPGKRDRMYAAIRTSLGKSPGSKLIALGTRPADDAHFFARLLASAPYAQVHAARSDDPPFRARTMRRANPSFDHLPSLRAQLAEEAVDARRDPDALASWRALRLNLGTDDTARSVLLDAASWQRASALPEPEAAPRGGYCLGLDLGTSAAMSAAAAYFRDGRLEAVAVFPETPDLAARGLSDGVGRLYVRMHERGELVLAGRRVSDIPSLLAEVLARWGAPSAVVIDRWRESELRDALDAARFPTAAVVVRGQGFKDGAQDVRDFRRALLSDRVRPAESLLLASAMAEARVVTDPSGNAKLSKGAQGGRRVRARDDAAAASVLAVAAGYREWHAAPRTARRPMRTALAG